MWDIREEGIRAIGTLEGEAITRRLREASASIRAREVGYRRITSTLNILSIHNILSTLRI